MFNGRGHFLCREDYGVVGETFVSVWNFTDNGLYDTDIKDLDIDLDTIVEEIWHW